MDKFSILIVEDNYNNIVSLRAILNKIEKCKYDIAQTGREALKMLLKNKYNLIMLDIHLPDMDGYELASMVKSRSKTADLPVVFVTGVYLTEIDKQKGFRLGAVDYILKPYTELELQNKIKQYINAFNKNQQYIRELREVNSRLLEQNTMLIEVQSRQVESESKWKQLVENIPDYIILLNGNHEIIYSNKDVEYKNDSKKIWDAIDAENINGFRNFIVNGISGNSHDDFEIKIKNTDKWYYVRMLDLGEDVKDSSSMIIMLDISKDKLNAKKIEYLNYHDGLTGLFNRNYLENYFARNDMHKIVPLSIVMADMNNLKLINDAFGHHKGDELLIEVSKYLQEIFRSKDVICRWGGDEFVIIMPHADYDEVNSLVKKIHKKSFMIGDLKITSKLAAGFNTITNPEHFNFSKEIIIAEDRMYRNKLTDEKSFRSNLIDSLKKALFEKSSETESHAERLKKMSVILSDELNLPESIKDDLILLASLHDIGKLGIGENILCKEEKLSDIEMNIIRKHPETGYNICKTIPELVPIAEYILCHHEWWDGNGYPRGLKAKEIPLCSRIISILDAYDAMTNDRPYRRAMTSTQALKEIRKYSGKQFDPELTDAFVKIVEQEKIKIPEHLHENAKVINLSDIAGENIS